MQAKHLLAVAAVAAAFTGVARAEGDATSQYALEFQGQRDRAEVQAEAAQVARTRSTEPAGSRIAEGPRSGLNPLTVRAEAIQALRLGKIPSGEIGG